MAAAQEEAPLNQMPPEDGRDPGQDDCSGLLIPDTHSGRG
jgi:hypothetical protein